MRRLINKLVYTGNCEEFYTDDDLTIPVMKIPYTLTTNVRQLEIQGKTCRLFVDHEETFWPGLVLKKLIGHLEHDSKTLLNFEVNFRNRDFAIKVDEHAGPRESVKVKKATSSSVPKCEVESSTGQNLNINGGGFHSLAGGRVFSAYGMFSPNQPTVTFLAAVALCQIYLGPLNTGTMP